jgi:hypothetical protein
MRLLRRKKTTRKEPLHAGISNTTKLLIGAGGLLLFIVGLKRSYRLDDQGGTVLADEVLRRADAGADAGVSGDQPRGTAGAASRIEDRS